MNIVHRVARFGRAAAALTVITMMLVGIPYGLATFIGWPLPDHLPAIGELGDLLISPLSDEMIVDGLACVLWATWACFALSLITELGAELFDRSVPRLPGFGWAQAISGALVGSLSLTSAATAATAAHATVPPSSATAITKAASPDQPKTSACMITVHRGDTLSIIAHRWLGSARAWPRIAAWNYGRLQPGGTRLTDPDVIHPGWHLRIRPAHHPENRPQPAHRQPQPSTPRPSASPSSHPTGQPGQDVSHTVRLPSGAIVGISLATAIGTAILLARRHRARRRRIAQVPGTAADEQLSPTQRRLRHAHLASQRDADDAPDLSGASARPGRQRGRHERPHALRGARQMSAPRRDPADAPALTPRQTPPDSVLPVGVRETTGEVGCDLTGVTGLGLAGPSVADVVRHLITYLLAPRSDNDTSAEGPPLRVDADRAEILLADAAASAALPPESLLSSVPGLVWTQGLDDALHQAEADIVHRSRLLTDADVVDYHAYRASHPDEPLPLVVLIAAPPAAAAARRLATVLTLGRNLGIAGILLGEWPYGATCTVDIDGRCTAVTDPVLAGLRDVQFGTLREADAVELLKVIAAAHGNHDLQEDQSQLAVGSDAVPPSAPTSPSEVTTQAGASSAREDDRTEHEAPPADVQLHILGTVHLTAGDREVGTGPRRKSKELLAWLALHPDGGSWETIAADLWPDADPDHARERVHDALTSLRRALRAELGPGRYISHSQGRYQLDTTAITDVDLWQFRRRLNQAAHANDITARADHLRAAAQLDTGSPGTDIDAEWIEPARETHRRNVADTHAHLADLNQANNPEAALDHLERAAEIDPYNEELARRIMRAQAELGRHDAVHRTFQLLESRLAELDAEPEDETHHLMHKLRAKRGKPATASQPGTPTG